MTRPATITQAELARIWKAAKTAGIPVTETLIEPDGTVRILHMENETDGADKALEDWLGDASP